MGGAHGDANYAGGTLVGPTSVRVGEYIRIGGHRVNGADQWRKVTAVDIQPFRLPVLTTVNESGAVRVTTVSRSMKVYLHPYSARRR